MKHQVNKNLSNKTRCIHKCDPYYCCEFLLNGINMLYQFKLWSMSTESMFAVVKENSEILEQLKVGDIFNMKYYSEDTISPTANFDTEIKYITKDDQGRFKGHYMIGLSILSDQKQIYN